MNEENLQTVSDNSVSDNVADNVDNTESEAQGNSEMSQNELVDALLFALNEQNENEDIETVSQNSVDYTEQLIQIQNTLDIMEQRMLVTPSGHDLKTMVNDLSYSELVLTIILIVLVCYGALKVIINNIFHLG